jgi:hypothetical protein
MNFSWQDINRTWHSHTVHYLLINNDPENNMGESEAFCQVKEARPQRPHAV